jgi:hypothetical protein
LDICCNSRLRQGKRTTDPSFDVTTLTAEIAELETRLSVESDRRECERAVTEIEGIKKRVKDQYLAFAPVIAGIRGATEMAAAIVPEGRALNEVLSVIATEVANAIDSLLGDLDRRIEALRAGHATPELPQSLNGSSELPQKSDGVLHLRKSLPRRQPGRKELVEDQCSIAAA